MELLNLNPGIIAGAIILVLIIVLIIIILLTGYVKASPNRAYIISGFKKKPRVLIGTAGIKIPFFEKKDELMLDLVSIEVKTSSAVPTADYININVDAAVNVKISDDPEKIALAAQSFLNRSIDYIASVAREVLEGNMREIVGKMKLEEMVSDRQKFAELVRENAQPDLAKMGLDIIAFNVQNFVDNQQVIENLGIDNVVKIKKQAAITKAVSEKEIVQAQAKAEQEANDARVESDTRISEKNNELAIKKAELKKISDAKLAEADAAYKIQEEQSRKDIEIATADANITRQEKEIELRRKEVEVTEQELEAQIKKKAEADKFAEQQKADAELYKRQRLSDAKLYELQKDAEAQKAEAEAIKYKMEQEAEGISAKGIAEAKAIEAKGIAEAEALDKKAEAMKKYGEAAIMEMYFNALPKIAESVAQPLNNVQNITMYGEGNNSKLIEDITKGINQIMGGISEGTGLDIKSLIDDFQSSKTHNVKKESQSESFNDMTHDDEDDIIVTID